MILDVECPNVAPAGLDVLNGIVIFVVQNIPRVVTDLHRFVIHLTKNVSALMTSCRIATMLFDDDGDSNFLCVRSHLDQVADESFQLAGCGFSERQEKWNFRRSGLI